MKKLLANLHYIFLAWIIWANYQLYEEHVVKMEELSGVLPPLQLAINKTKNQLKGLQRYYKDVERAKEHIDMVAKQVEDLQRQLPNEVSDTKNLHLFSEITKSINLKDVYLNPDREDLHGFYITKDYVLKASGTYLQFLVFLERLQKEKSLFNIKSLSLVQSPVQQRGRFQLINGEIRISAYRYNTGYREDRGFDKIEQELKDQQKAKRKNNRKARNKK